MNVLEILLNATMGMCGIILQPITRTAHNFQNDNNDVPTVYELRKDSKPFINTVM